jgi:hypothetical protein
MVKVLNEYVLFLLQHLIISSMGRLMPQINVSEIREIDVHFAYVLKELVAIQFISCLKFIKNYIHRVLGLRKFNEKFRHLSLFKYQNLYYRPKATEFLKDLLICQFKNYSLVDTD